jgi:hypothetical protein
MRWRDPRAACYIVGVQARQTSKKSHFWIVGLLLAIVFSLPAFESHACPSTGSQVISGAESVWMTSASDDRAGCPDCGPACAGGCCHAPHSGVAADLMVRQTVIDFERSSTWSNVVRSPMNRPSGPERPPRL